MKRMMRLTIILCILCFFTLSLASYSSICLSDFDVASTDTAFWKLQDESDYGSGGGGAGEGYYHAHTATNVTTYKLANGAESYATDVTAAIGRWGTHINMTYSSNSVNIIQNLALDQEAQATARTKVDPADTTNHRTGWVMYINTNEYANPLFSSLSADGKQTVLAHEIGHIYGLGHANPFNYSNHIMRETGAELGTADVQPIEMIGVDVCTHSNAHIHNFTWKDIFVKIGLYLEPRHAYVCTGCNGYYTNTLGTHNANVPATICGTKNRCSVCNTEMGDPLEHDYISGNCPSRPRICTRAGCPQPNQGSSYGGDHYWLSATCQSPSRCFYCNTTSGGYGQCNYYNGYCSTCGEPDPNSSCQHSSTTNWWYLYESDNCYAMGSICTDCGSVLYVSSIYPHMVGYDGYCIDCGMYIGYGFYAMQNSSSSSDLMNALEARLTDEIRADMITFNKMYQADTTSIKNLIKQNILSKKVGELKKSILLSKNSEGKEYVDIYLFGQTNAGDDIQKVVWYNSTPKGKVIYEEYYIYPNGYYRPNTTGKILTSELPVRPDMSIAQKKLLEKIDSAKKKVNYPVIERSAALDETKAYMYALGKSRFIQEMPKLSKPEIIKVFGAYNQNADICLIGKTKSGNPIYKVSVYNQDNELIMDYVTSKEATILFIPADKSTISPPYILNSKPNAKTQ